MPLLLLARLVLFTGVLFWLATVFAAGITATAGLAAVIGLATTRLTISDFMCDDVSLVGSGTQPPITLLQAKAELLANNAIATLIISVLNLRVFKCTIHFLYNQINKNI